MTIHEELWRIAERISKKICVSWPVWTTRQFIHHAKVCSPVVYIELREGIAIYDKDFFVPLQEQFKNTTKTVELSRSFRFIRRSSEKLKKMVFNLRQKGFLQVSFIDVYGPLIFSSNLLLMGVGAEPAVPVKLSDEMDEHLVKSGLLKQKYVRWLKRTIKDVKRFEHAPWRHTVREAKAIIMAKKFAKEIEKVFAAHVEPDVLIFMTEGGEKSTADNADKKSEVQVMNMSAELEKAPYEQKMSRRDFLKAVSGLGGVYLVSGVSGCVDFGKNRYVFNT